MWRRKPKFKWAASGDDEDDYDQWTTIMLSNLPKDITADTLLAVLEKQGLAAGHKFDFFYLPIDFQTYTSMGYAFVNFHDTEDALKCMTAFDGFRDWPVSGPAKTWKTCTTRYGRYQGLNANIRRFRNSSVSVMDMQDNFKPIIFDKEGKRIPLWEAIQRTDSRGGGHSWSQCDWQWRRKHGSWGDGWSRSNDDWHLWHGRNEGQQPAWGNSGNYGEAEGVDTDATGPEEKALQGRQELEAGAAVVSAGKAGAAAAEPPSVAEAEAVADLAHGSVAATSDFFPVQPQGSSQEMGVGSFEEAKVRPSQPATKYVCSACGDPFLKWSACKHHIFSTFKCKVELVLDSSTLEKDKDKEAALQDCCRV